MQESSVCGMTGRNVVVALNGFEHGKGNFERRRCWAAVPRVRAQASSAVLYEMSVGAGVTGGLVWL